MVNENVQDLLLFLESIDVSSNPNIIGAVRSAICAIFENEIREAKKDYILGIVKFIDSDGNVDYSSDKVPPKDIEEQIAYHGITNDELIEARKAHDKFQNIKSDLF